MRPAPGKEPLRSAPGQDGPGGRVPLQNRVLPTGEIVADPARGTLTGNRGILHGGDRTLGARRWTHPHWISCTLDWKGTRRTPMTPGTWTELFFLDEAVAMAAGHRPCALCRRGDWLSFRAAWAAAVGGPATAPAIDAALHAARVSRDRRQRRHEAPARDLPAGAFVLLGDDPHLLTRHGLHPFAPAGYGAPLPRPAGLLTVLTPAPLVAVLRAGYAARLHPSAQEPPCPT
jgi:hypothetical protein